MSPRGDAEQPRDRPVKLIRVITRLNVGGPAQNAVLLTAHLDRSRWCSILVTGVVGADEGDMSDVAYAQGVSPIVLPTLRNRAGPIADLRSLLFLYRLFRRERPTVVHLHLLKARALGGVAARLAGVPVIVETFHGTLFSGYYGAVVSRLLIWAERFLGRLMHGVIAVSAEVAEEITRLRITDPRKIRVIPLGLDLDRFAIWGDRPGILRDELGVSRQVPLVGIVGRLVAIKGHAYFVQAAARVAKAIPEARFVIVGDGPERGALEHQVRAAGLGERVRFLGWRRDLERVYPDLDVVVLSSLNEGTPVSVIEAMAAGRPVVATRVGGVPDLIEHGETGILVPPGDGRSIAEAVTSLLHDGALRSRIGRAAQAAVYPRFTVARLAQDTATFYGTLVPGLREGRV